MAVIAWLEKNGRPMQHDGTAESVAALAAQGWVEISPPPGDGYTRQAGAWVVDVAALNAPTLAALAQLDAKKVRALSDAILQNDSSRLAMRETDAAALRARLVK